MRQSTIDKYKAVQARYKHLYHTKRLRIDDVYQQLAKEFYFSVRWVEEVLRMDLSETKTIKSKQK